MHPPSLHFCGESCRGACKKVTLTPPSPPPIPPAPPPTPAVAAEKAAEELAKKALKLGYGSATVKLKGVGNSKQYVVQSLGAAGLQLTRLMDVTPIPYNGCRRSKRRRV